VFNNKLCLLGPEKCFKQHFFDAHYTSFILTYRKLEQCQSFHKKFLMNILKLFCYFLLRRFDYITQKHSKRALRVLEPRHRRRKTISNNINNVWMLRKEMRTAISKLEPSFEHPTKQIKQAYSSHWIFCSEIFHFSFLCSTTFPCPIIDL